MPRRCPSWLNEGGPTMSHQRLNPYVIALAAALTIGLSSGSRAQSADSTKRAAPTKSAAATKPTSAKRIKVKKDSAAGEVALPKSTDTAVVAVDTTTRVDKTTRGHNHAGGLGRACRLGQRNRRHDYEGRAGLDDGYHDGCQRGADDEASSFRIVLRRCLRAGRAFHLATSTTATIRASM